MKTIHLDLKRRADAETIFHSGSFTYRMNADWLKLPQGCEQVTVASVFCDALDRVFLLTRGTDRPLMVFDSQGNFLYDGAADCFEKAHGLFITSKGELLCTDAQTHVCYRMSMKGDVLQTFGEWNKPSDTGYDLDAYKKLREIGVIAPDAPYNKREEFLARLDTVKQSAGPFNRPTRLIQASDGKLFCSDGYGNASVHRFSADGVLEKSWGAPGIGPGEFRTVHGVWIDRFNRVWIADRENERVQVFTWDGELIMLADGMLRPTDFWADEDYIYVSEADGGVTIFNSDMDIVSQLGYKNSPLLGHSIGGNSQGDLFIATLGLSKIHRFIKLERI